MILLAAVIVLGVVIALGGLALHARTRLSEAEAKRDAAEQSRAGLAAILYGEFSNTNRNQVPDMGLIQADDATNNPLSFPPILGVAGILAGGGLVLYGARQSR